MNKFLLVLGAIAAGALLIPDVAEAQRGGRGGGGARIGGGAGFRGGSVGAGPRMYLPRGGVGGPRVGLNPRGAEVSLLLPDAAGVACTHLAQSIVAVMVDTAGGLPIMAASREPTGPTIAVTMAEVGVIHIMVERWRRG